MEALVQGLLALGALLFAKHLLADGPLQTPYHLANKGRLLHPGGLAHAGVHTALSALCFGVWHVLFAPASFGVAEALPVFAMLLALEFVLHYLIDFTKCQFDARFQLSTTVIADDGRRLTTIEGGAFFIAFLCDQTAHSLTYIGMLAVLAHHVL